MHKSKAHKDFLALPAEKRLEIAERVFVALEYDEDDKPGSTWSPDTISWVAEAFTNNGVEFTPPEG